LKKAPFRSLRLSAQLLASGSNFNPRNIPYIPVVEIIAFLDLDQNWAFFKGLIKPIRLFTLPHTVLFFLSLGVQRFPRTMYGDLQQGSAF